MDYGTHMEPAAVGSLMQTVLGYDRTGILSVAVCGSARFTRPDLSCRVTDVELLVILDNSYQLQNN